jgi:Chitobiase/beta-hexosaminidase C-terminal domain
MVLFRDKKIEAVWTGVWEGNHRMLKKLGCALCIAILIFTITGCVTPKPKFSPAPGVYNCPETVTINDARVGAAIFYTTDGSVPTVSSTKYTGPFAVRSTDKVQAIAIAPGAKASSVATVSYTCTFTRADFAQMVQQRFSLPAPQHALVFPDVHPNDPNYAAVQAVALYMNPQVLCPGCVLNRNFFPDQPITRAVSTIALVRIMAATGKLQLLSEAESDRVLSSSRDGKQLPRLARPYFATAIVSGVISVLPGNKVAPSTANTRDEMTAVLDHLQTQFNRTNVTPK